MLFSQQALGPQTLKRWMPVAIIALVAVTAGIAMPRALPATSNQAKTLPPEGTTPAEASLGKGPLVYTPPPPPEDPDPRSMLTRLGIATAVVLALCVGTLWFGRRWLGGPATQPAGTSQLRLMETLALGGRCVLHLVRVGDRPVLIAADQSGVKSVVQLAEPFERALAEAIEPEL